MNQWAANGEMQDQERYGQCWERSGHGKQRCSELFLDCLRDTEGRGDRGQGRLAVVKNFCGICGQNNYDGM